MTPEELTKLVTKGSYAEIATALSGFSEAERRKLSKTAAGLLRGEADLGLYGYYRAGLAVLALCPLSVAKKMDWFARDREHDSAVVRVLADRRPPWIDSWLDALLSTSSPNLPFRIVRELVRAGLAQTPDAAGYATVFSWHHLTWSRKNPGRYVPLSRQLLVSSFKRS